jgi:two-component system CheB/CheR fusion protein
MRHLLKNDVENLKKEQLEQELIFTKESLRATIEELQSSNEEIRSSNEELQSTNEELQSSNEELETSKEEMLSLNEELNTVNSELQNKIECLSEVNDDMQNLMNSTDIAIVFLDTQLKIKRFTRQAKNIFKLIDSDIGRPLADLVSILRYDGLIADAKTVLQTLIYRDVEVPSLTGGWYLLRILPYRTTENMIDGLVVTFVDISQLKKAEQTVQAAALASAIVNSLQQPLLVLDEHLCVISSNPSYNQLFHSDAEQLKGQSLFSIHNAIWNSIPLGEQLNQTLTNLTAFDKFCYEADFSAVKNKQLLINGRILKQLPHSPTLILLAIDDVSTQQKKE